MKLKHPIKHLIIYTAAFAIFFSASALNEAYAKCETSSKVIKAANSVNFRPEWYKY